MELGEGAGLRRGRMLFDPFERERAISQVNQSD
jgi:hypothetical protein